MSQTVTTLSLDTSNYLKGWRLHAVIACLFFGAFTIALDTSIINVAVPNISSDFGTIEDVAWYGAAYLVTVTCFQPIWGSWFRYFQTDVVYRASIAIFEVGSILCAAAVDSRMFIVGRAVAGFGAAGVLQGALSIISQVVELDKRPLYFGIVISVFLITTSVGPVLSGVFTEKVTWRWCFWINLPIGALVLAGLTVFLKIKGAKNTHRSKPFSANLKSMDPLGCVLFIGAVVCLLLALQWGGQTKPWNSPDVIGCLIGATLLAILFAIWQWKAGEEALVPLRVLQKRSIWTGAAVLFFSGAHIYLDSFFLPFWFQGVKAFGPVTTGVDFIALLLPQVVALVAVGAVVQKFGQYVPWMIAGELIAVGGQIMLTQLEPGSSTVYWAASLVVSGFGDGLVMQLPYTAIALVLSDEVIPVGNAIAVFFYQLGGGVFISIGQTVTVTTLLELVPARLPQIPTQSVISAGAANLATLTQDPQLLDLLRSIWSVAVTRTMYVGFPAMVATIPFTLGMEWLNSVKVAQARKENSEQVASLSKRAEESSNMT